MPLFPQGLAAKIQFFEAHLADWTTNAVAIGSSAAEITAISTKTTAARAALTAQETAQETARTRTAALRSSVEAMTDAGSDLIKKVRAKAATDGDVIYQLANIPAPATPAPIGPPGTPFDFKVTLLPSGALEFVFKCNNPAGSAGTVYQVYRRNTPTAEPTYLGVAGIKKFIDDAVPSGLTQFQYLIQATRSTAVGVQANFTVRFGTGSEGEMTATIVESVPAKIAA